MNVNLGGVVHADEEPEALSELAALFARYGVEPFLESTHLLVVLLDKEGSLLSWNPSFESYKKTHPDKAHLKDFLSTPSEELFDHLLSSTLQKRTRTKGGWNSWPKHGMTISCAS